MSASNLRFAEEAAELLREDGLAELRYLTAEFEPFSSSQRPDLLFSPRLGRGAGRWFVIEMRVELPPHGRPPPVAALIEHRAFIQDDLGATYVFFGLATNGSVLDTEAIAQLAVEGVEVFSGVKNGAVLADVVREWSGRAEPPPWASQS